jgi:xanthine dehydrogenase YagS FAD-binding subunit
MIPNFTFVRPKSLKEAVELLAKPGARAHSGGTDLLGCLRDEVFTAGKVVSLTGLSELKGIAPSDAGLRIGALTTLAQVASDPKVAATYRVLSEGAASAASPQLRNQGTLGGNLCQRPRCWYFRGDFHCLRKGGETCYAVDGENQFHALFGGGPCYIVHPSDTASPLIALEARFRIVGPSGTRTVDAESFFVLPDVDVQKENVLRPGEILTEVLVPAPPAGSRSTYLKVRSRGSWDFALAGAAVVLVVAGGKVTKARVVLSGVAPVPWRAKKAEEALAGKTLDPATIRAAAAAASAGAQPMSGNAFKVDLVGGAVEEALLAIA